MSGLGFTVPFVALIAAGAVWVWWESRPGRDDAHLDGYEDEEVGL